MQVEKWLNPGGAKSSSWLVSPARHKHIIYKTMLRRISVRVACVGPDIGHLVIPRIEFSAVI
jgi:hypothetical protein